MKKIFTFEHNFKTNTFLKTYKLLLLALPLLTLLLISCNEKESCPDTQVPYLRMAISNASTSKIDSLFVYSTLLSDSIYKDKKTPEFLNVPLKLDSDTSIFNLGILYSAATKETDTLFLSYTIQLKVDRLECGFSPEFKLEMVTSTTHFIDSINVLNGIINSESKTHVKIFF